ncbi:MAG: glycosyltransferase family 4 protein [Acaryochloridaceae cyanobacterium RU_4_10]|nr:glycosyltransferase family 4 protein [Acaryochloridaceae cyanobacterium RU_4_10]
MNFSKDLRIAWLLTSAFYYWHPPIAYLAKLFPETTAFVANWRGYAPGFEDSFKINIVGERKIIPIFKEGKSYGTYFTYLPLNIVNRLLQFKPDVIFANSFGVWTILALLFKPFGQWRVVIAYEGSSPGVDYRNSNVRLSMRRTMVRAADACITNSQAGEAYLTKVLNADPSRVFVHPYEVPDPNAMLGEKKAGIPELPSYQQPIFVFVGSISTRKGLNFLLDACALLHTQGFNRYTVLVVGDGEQQEELKQFAQEKGLSDRIQWTGRVEYGNLGAYFSAADVFVLPTLEDTWGMVTLEAMVLGKPVLCSKWAGTSELVIQGENGYSFDPYEPQQLADLMRRFIEDPNLASIMGAKARQFMAQYTPEEAAKFLSQVTSVVLEE